MLTIGIDLGTSGIKAVLMEDATRAVAQAVRPVAVSIPQVGWSEQDPDLWVGAVWACLDDLAEAQPDAMAAVAGIGLSGQMLAALVLGPDLRPLRPAMLWNDQRAIAECAELLAAVPDIGSRTNGTPDPGITAPKLLWLARHEPAVMARARMLLLTKDYVRLALTGEVASEATDAGGTQLLDCRSGQWDAGLCAAIGWDPEHLPPLITSWGAAGGLRPALARRWGLRPGTPVAAGAGDNMGSTLGAGGARPGDAVVTVGTSAVACLVDAAFHPGPEVAILTSAHAAPECFLSMGVVMAATAALDWTARIAGTTVADLAARAEAFANTGRIAEAPLFLPCLNGIRTPTNRPGATGQMTGLHPGVDAAMLAYATMEGVALQIESCIMAQQAVGVAVGDVVAVGGGTRSPLWMRLLASALDRPVALPEGADFAGPGGAARLAIAAATGSTDALYIKPPTRAVIDPDPMLAAHLAARKERFQALVRRA
ncbi:FGGY family carbohydrate kinase [Tabrizicola sp.]|uniref:xylulokinase n=1 Tax=Tabrizicola sp. TaxID=2005166 RepID=UPI00286A5AE0|nr:FGGY family carbohydrate kinase [Tabrizicola sp.]